MSRDALMMRSRRSWCSSRLSRNFSNMGMKGEVPDGDVCVASKGCCLSLAIIDTPIKLVRVGCMRGEMSGGLIRNPPVSLPRES